MSLTREILIDVMHNRGTTPNQIQHRLKNHPAPVVRSHIGILVESGHLHKRGNTFLDISQSGMKYLIPAGRP